MQNNKLSIEEIIKKLEDNVNIMQNSDTSIDENIRIYKESIELYDRAEKLLVETKQKIEIYNPENGITEDFDVL